MATNRSLPITGIYAINLRIFLRDFILYEKSSMLRHCLLVFRTFLRILEGVLPYACATKNVWFLIYSHR
jgi:hypothetical protein